jgi:hypothetical protein
MPNCETPCGRPPGILKLLFINIEFAHFLRHNSDVTLPLDVIYMANDAILLAGFSSPLSNIDVYPNNFIQ